MEPVKPTVGRIIHFWPENCETEVTCAAIVTATHDADAELEIDAAINIFFWTPEGATGTRQLTATPADKPASGRWWWPQRA